MVKQVEMDAAETKELVVTPENVEFQERMA